MSTTPLHILIVGGGIGGLCLAQGLKKAGMSVAVYERDRTRTDRLQGYRIHINPAGSRALHACLPADLYDTFVVTCGQSNKGIAFFDEQMRQLLTLRIPNADGPLDPVESHKSVSRITLRQVLLAGLDGVVHLDKVFTRYEHAPDGTITAHFADGTTATGDVLVGADGGNSRVRQQFLPQAERIDTGILGIAGKVPLTDEARSLLPPVLFDGPASVLAPKGHGMFIAVQEFGHGPVAAGEIGGNDAAALAHDGLLFDNTADYIMWSFSARREKFGFTEDPKRMDGPTLQAVVLRLIAGWHPRFRHLVRMADLASIALLPILSATPDAPQWETTNITLIGDAIHSMTPFRGIGANTALRDADLLRAQLIAAHAGRTPLLDAIRTYETTMRDYGFAAVRSSYKAAQQAMVDNPLALAMTKAMFRTVNAIPPAKHAVMRSFGGE